MRSRRRRLWSWMLQIIVAVAVIPAVTALPDEIKVGGLFETTDEQQELAFGYAINSVNTNYGILPSSKLSAQVKKVAPQDSFRSLKAACEFLEKGVAAIIAPPSPSTVGVLQSTCDSFHVPLLQTHWDYRAQLGNFSINLFPHPSVLATAFLEVIRDRHWKSFTLIYEDNEALIRLQELLKAPSKDHKIKVRLRQVSSRQNFMKLMKDLRISRENNFVLDLPLHRVLQLFNDAQEVEMFTDYQNYFLTSLDIHTINWPHGLGGKANVTSLRLVNPETEMARRMITDWRLDEERQGRKEYVSNGLFPLYHTIKTESALLYDAVSLLAKALDDLDRGQAISLRSLSCDLSDQWSYGISLANYMKAVPRPGVSGEIKLDKNGQRTNFGVDIVKLKKDRIDRESTWDPENGVQRVEQSAAKTEDDTSELFKGKTLIVTTVLGEPYMKQLEPKEQYRGNDMYSGYCKDLLDKIAEKLKFNYTIMPSKDRKHGGKLPTGEWNGMMGHLLRREADLAIGDMTITYEREEVVDFTMPFMNLGISILFKKQEKKNPPLFSFLEPLSLEVWFFMATAFLGVSLLMFLLARLSPYEWVNPHPCDPDNDVVENQFNLLNSFWFAIGSIMQQGSDLLPRAISTRIVASSWWFFTLIMISSYTANLAAFLTAQRMTSPITNANDLSKQTRIKYGCYEGGSTKRFFQNSTYPTYKRMWAYMESDKSVLTKSNDEGIERVIRGDYAFLMESSSIEFNIAKRCDLVKIGGELDTKGYGIATQPGSPYRNGLSSAVLQLQESGQLHVLKEKWWKKSKCPDDGSEDSAEMGIGKVGGVFLVLCIGMALGLIVVVFEYIWKAKKQLNRDPIPVMLWQELKFILSCRGSSRPAPKEDDDDEPSVDKFQMLPVKKDEEDAEKYS